MKNMIYERYGPLAMYDKGVDTLTCHWVVGYQVSHSHPGYERNVLRSD